MDQTLLRMLLQAAQGGRQLFVLGGSAAGRGPSSQLRLEAVHLGTERVPLLRDGGPGCLLLLVPRPLGGAHLPLVLEYLRRRCQRLRLGAVLLHMRGALGFPRLLFRCILGLQPVLFVANTRCGNGAAVSGGLDEGPCRGSTYQGLARFAVRRVGGHNHHLHPFACCSNQSKGGRTPEH